MSSVIANTRRVVAAACTQLRMFRFDGIRGYEVIPGAAPRCRASMLSVHSGQDYDRANRPDAASRPVETRSTLSTKRLRAAGRSNSVFPRHENQCDVLRDYRNGRAYLSLASNRWRLTAADATPTKTVRTPAPARAHQYRTISAGSAVDLPESQKVRQLRFTDGVIGTTASLNKRCADILVRRHRAPRRQRDLRQTRPSAGDVREGCDTGLTACLPTPVRAAAPRARQQTNRRECRSVRRSPERRLPPRVPCTRLSRHWYCAASGRETAAGLLGRGGWRER